MGYIFLIIALTLNASGNILLKQGAKNIGKLKGLPPLELALGVLTNIPLVIGLFLFAMNVVFYTIALSKLNISIAYPIMMVGGIVIISLFSVFHFKESLSNLQMIGLVLIAGGIVLLTATQGQTGQN